jgi:hypothetical protein
MKPLCSTIIVAGLLLVSLGGTATATSFTGNNGTKIGTVDSLKDYGKSSSGPSNTDKKGSVAGIVSRALQSFIGTDDSVNFSTAKSSTAKSADKNSKNNLPEINNILHASSDPSNTKGNTKANSGLLGSLYTSVAYSAASSLFILKPINSSHRPVYCPVPVSPLPLPASLPLFAAGLAAVGVLARRRNKL